MSEFARIRHKCYKREAGDKAALGAASPVSESVSGWVTPVASAESQEDRRKNITSNY